MRIQKLISIYCDCFYRTEEQNTALSALPKSQCNVEKSVLNPMADEFVPLCHQIDYMAS